MRRGEVVRRRECVRSEEGRGYQVYENICAREGLDRRQPPRVKQRPKESSITRTVVIVGSCGLLARWLRVVIAMLHLDIPSPLTRHNAEPGVGIVHDVLILGRLLSAQTSPITLC